MLKIDKLKEIIINVPNFPKKGINFKDITPIFANSVMTKKIINHMAKLVKNIDFDVIISPELRGYLFGIPLALKVKKPFIFVRKKGKLPRATTSISYDLEYGKAELEIHKDALKPGTKVLIVDDLLATGGTVQAIEALVKKMNCSVIGSVYLIELTDLNAKDKLNHPTFPVIQY